MSVFSDNIRYLRHKLKLSQQSVAEQLLITRGRYSKYEDGVSEPPLDLLLKISKYYKISIDLMLTVDVRKYSLEEIIKLPDNRIVLPVMMDAAHQNQIEIIPHRGSMGYLEGYMDPGYIEELQSISLPFLRNGKFRAFPVSGDSMPPYNEEGTFIVAKYVEDVKAISPGKTYVFVTRSQGITFKRFNSHSAEGLIVSADNEFYQPFEILYTDLYEVWEFACSISTQEFDRDFMDTEKFKNLLEETLRRLENRKATGTLPTKTVRRLG